MNDVRKNNRIRELELKIEELLKVIYDKYTDEEVFNTTHEIAEKVEDSIICYGEP